MRERVATRRMETMSVVHLSVARLAASPGWRPGGRGRGRSEEEVGQRRERFFLRLLAHKSLRRKGESPIGRRSGMHVPSRHVPCAQHRLGYTALVTRAPSLSLRGCQGPLAVAHTQSASGEDGFASVRLMRLPRCVSRPSALPVPVPISSEKPALAQPWWAWSKSAHPLLRPAAMRGADGGRARAANSPPPPAPPHPPAAPRPGPTPTFWGAA